MEEHVKNSTSSLVRQALLTSVFLFGVTGNVIALWILYKPGKPRNRKHVLMLRCLATNDLIAEVGMLSVTTLQKFDLVSIYWSCLLFVILRGFGIGSGCVALVMALERWLALTRPFLYQQIVTYRTLKTFILIVWSGGALLTYLPLFGFGLYYDGTDCRRYRHATEILDQVYAYMFFGFGTCLCICITVCNLRVIWELSRIHDQGRVLVRRTTVSAISNRSCAAKYQTPEELAFAKLMAVICIIFVSCWAPQMVLIPMGRYCTDTSCYRVLSKMADFLMCAYLTLDPYVYVLQRYFQHKETIFSCCFSKKSTNSLPTTSSTETNTVGLLQPSSTENTSVISM